MPTIDSTTKKWWVVDLDGMILGRAAVQVANILRGKDKPIFSPHCDAGDHVVIINSGNVRVTGAKLEKEFYYRYSGYPGGLKKISLGKKLEKQPEEVFRLAVRRMLPKNRLGRKIIKKLHIYAGDVHPHSAQRPEVRKLG